MKTVLLVEDNEDDIALMKMACMRTGIPHSLHVVNNGRDAIKYLSHAPPYADKLLNPVPDLIFLDVKLPVVDGHEVLEWIRLQPGFRSVPVVMLSSSNHEADVERAYHLGVTSYLHKIPSVAEFGQGVRVILKYWLELNIPMYRERPSGELEFLPA
jgi:CheY-like chemotaxis protein